VVAVAPETAAAVVDRARAADVPALLLGHAGGDRLVADGAFAVPLADATAAWRDAIPRSLGR
jgi:phosphoribosylformylglycinamidine synthase subunit PurL